MKKRVELKLNEGRKSIGEWFRITKEAAREWSLDEAFLHAAALGFYTLFSLAPILIIAIAVAGFVFGPEAARGEISQQIEEMIGRESAKLVEEALLKSHPEVAGFFRSLVGFALLIVGATTVFHQLQRSLNSIWGVMPKPSRSSILIFIKGRILSLALVLVIGFLLLVSLVFSTVLTTLLRYARELIPVPGWVLTGADMVIALAVFTVLFGLIFQVLPDVRLRWRDVWKGALVTAILFTIGRYLISLYLGYFGPASTYGAAGALVAIIFWVYYSGLILLFGAEFTKVYVRSRGYVVLPRKTAVRVRREILEE